MARVIALYLPQFHSVPENDEWWGKGFTEWYNVGKAKPLYPGHVQPKVPTDLGYYNLLLEESRIEQAELAKRAGIEGFCYWHYWFGNGRQLLEKPLQMVVESGKPDLPFCLGWANHSWERKVWTDTNENKMLIKQEYGGVKDFTEHFNTVLPMFKDERYIKVDGKPLFLVFAPRDIENLDLFFETWRKLAFENGLPGVHFVAHSQPLDEDLSEFIKMGYDAVCPQRVAQATSIRVNAKKNKLVALKLLMCRIFNLPKLVDYKFVIKNALNKADEQEFVYPQLSCGWDHTPRSGRAGAVFDNFSLDLFKEHILSVGEEVIHKEKEHQIIFLKSWNEWGEGNFMEPDLEYGMGKIDTMREALRILDESK